MSALYLATATGQPVVGKLVDLFGVRRVFLAGTALAGIAGVIGTLAVQFPGRSPRQRVPRLRHTAPLPGGDGRVPPRGRSGVWRWGGRGGSPSAAGLVLLPMFAVAIVASVLTGRRRGVRGKLVGGSIAQLVACGLLLALQPTSPVWLLVLVSVIVGVPQGVNSLANQNAVYHQADLETIGSSAALLRTFTYLGAIVAAAANAAVFTAGADTAGLHQLAVFILAVAALLLAASLADRSLSRI